MTFFREVQTSEPIIWELSPNVFLHVMLHVIRRLCQYHRLFFLYPNINHRSSLHYMLGNKSNASPLKDLSLFLRAWYFFLFELSVSPTCSKECVIFSMHVRQVYLYIYIHLSYYNLWLASILYLYMQSGQHSCYKF